MYFWCSFLFVPHVNATAVPPEHPMVLNRYGLPLNGTILGPMEEGDDVMLTCRVIGGKYTWFFAQV